VENRIIYAYLTGTILLIVFMFLKQPFNLTLAPLVSGLAIAYLLRKGLSSFLIGILAGLTGLLLLGGAGLFLSLKIMMSAGGVIIPVLVIVYHMLAPGLFAGGFTILFKKK
jgi:hypothetical protein